MKTAAILVAGGSGSRLPGELAKQWRLLNGKPVYAWSLDVLCHHPKIDSVILVVPNVHVLDIQETIRQSPALYGGCTVVAGGAQRRDSVFAGLCHLPRDTASVIVHDAARPFITAELIDASLRAVAQHGAVTTAIPPVDTVLEIQSSQIMSVPARSGLALAQTPQTFDYAILRHAHETVPRDLMVTDDAGLVLTSGHPVFTIPGTSRNIKITTETDWVLSTYLARGG